MDILTKKGYRQFNRVSRYSSVPYYYNQTDDKYLLGTVFHISKDIAYTEHTIKPGESWDSIALDYYGTPVYYWAICEFNRINDAYTMLPVGTIIRVPNFSNITFDEVR